MKKVFNLLVFFVLIAGFSACSKDDPGNQQVPKNPVPSADYKGLAFISSGESTVRLAQVGTPYEISLEYSTDETHWKPYTIGETISLADSTFLLFRNGEHKNRKFSKDDENYYHFEISGPISAQGNIMSLLNRDFSTPLTFYGFFALFEGCTSLLSAPELPATTMEKGCYSQMFAGCTALKYTPELPAEVLATNCYRYMFRGCSTLTSAPELPATKMEQGCYFGMFSECTELTSVPELQANVLANNCYGWMFKGCSALTSAPELPATEMEAYCYNGMFANCTKLTSAPELPAKRLESNCYNCMFEGCTSLTSAPELPATYLVRECYHSMFNGCTSLTSAPKLPATTLEWGCYSEMFQGCTSLTSAPELPAKELIRNCYQLMFKDCSKLRYVKALFTTSPSEETTKDWLSGVAASGTFVKSKNATWNVTGVHDIPKGWKIETR